MGKAVILSLQFKNRIHCSKVFNYGIYGGENFCGILG